MRRRPSFILFRRRYVPKTQKQRKSVLFTMSLPEEVVVEIFSWLPVKSLLRFKCVSKRWLHLISADAAFINLHHNHSIQGIIPNQNPNIIISCASQENPGLYHVEDYTACNEAMKFDITFPNGFRFVNICRGLLCLTDNYDEEQVCVWNPLMKDLITISLPPIPSPSDDFAALCGPKDVVFAFGFCEDSNEYKVIQFVSTSAWEHYEEFYSHVSVHTLGTGSWRNLEDDSLQYNINDDGGFPVLVNGALHWYASAPPSTSYMNDIIVSFDLRDEIFQEIPQPEGLRPICRRDMIIGELGGCLSIVSKLHEDIEFWVMKQYGVVRSWTKQFKIGKLEMGYLELEPLGFANNGQIITVKNDLELVLCDPKTNSICNICKFDSRDQKFAYTPSLISPKAITGGKEGMQAAKGKEIDAADDDKDAGKTGEVSAQECARKVNSALKDFYEKCLTAGEILSPEYVEVPRCPVS